jgi:hypothetical protein
MDQQLYKYLVLHKNLAIPQLGSFVVTNEPSHFDSTTGMLHAPKPVIYFTDTTIPMSEKFFFDFLSAEMGIDEVTAIKQFHDYAYQLRKDLTEKKHVEVGGIGTLTKGEDELVSFNSTHDISALLPPVQKAEAIPVTDTNDAYDREEISDIEEGKDQWWVYALVLLMIGLGALLYYYI